MRYNAMFAEIADEQTLSEVTQADLPDLFKLALGEGWIKDKSGAWLLKQFLATYSGTVTAFTDVTGYEAVVNGRGVPDFDLSSDGTERAKDLAKRAFSFARMALFHLNQSQDHPAATSFISISHVEMDDDEIYTASVTFVSHHDGEPPYVESVEALTSNALLAVESAECIEPLPAGRLSAK